MVIWNDNSQKKLAAGEMLSPNEWHFVALSVDGNHGTLYVDGLNVAEQTWDGPLGDGRNPFMIGGNARFNQFLRMKLASFAIYPQALDGDSIGKLYLKQRDVIAAPPDPKFSEDYQFLLDLTTALPKDRAEFPATLTLAPGTTIQSADGGPVLDFDGKSSSVQITENPRIHVLAVPFSVIMDFKPAPGAEGCLFRRTFNPGLWLRKDGSLLFDANSAENNQVIVPNAVTPAQWNQLMVTFDGKTFSVYRDGTRIAQQPYTGNEPNWERPLVVGADGTGRRILISSVISRCRYGNLPSFRVH